MDYKVLVNKKNKINKNIINNTNLIMIKNYLNKDIFIEKKTYSMYKKLKDYLSSINIEIGIDSGYRSIEDQKLIYEEMKKLYGESYAENYIAKEGYSEHHTGLCIDLVLKIDNRFITSNNELFAKEEIFDVIHSCLPIFGFILRYPKEKENITGYLYEPWHIRYVGESTANIIYNENLTLEEYHKKYNINGVLLVNKPSGITSREVDNIIACKFDTKVGHTGTLDPLASGVLIVLIGSATKICQDITVGDKKYIATVKVGIRTDTLDITGNVLEENEDYSIDNLEELIKSFEKSYMQEVPIYSAIKVDGKKLYEYARNKEKVDLPKKEVTIKNIELLNKEKDTFTFKCKVSKGTYIRSLIRDMGNSIGKLFTMKDLIRVEEASFSLDECYTLDEINANKYDIISIDKVLPYKVVEIDESILKMIKNGCIIKNDFEVDDKVIFKTNNNIIAIYEVTCDNKLKSYKNFC